MCELHSAEEIDTSGRHIAKPRPENEFWIKSQGKRSLSSTGGAKGWHVGDEKTNQKMWRAKRFSVIDNFHFSLLDNYTSSVKSFYNLAKLDGETRALIFGSVKRLPVGEDSFANYRCHCRSKSQRSNLKFRLRLLLLRVTRFLVFTYYFYYFIWCDTFINC